MAEKKDDGIPQSVLDEVDKIREQEGGESAEEEGAGLERAAVPKPPSRREQKEREREERETRLLAAAEDARKIAEEERTARRADGEKLARLEALIEAQVLNQRTQVQQTPQRQEPDDDWRDKVSKEKRAAKDALAKGDIDEYHDRLEKAEDIKRDQLRREFREQQAAQQQAQPQQFQKPPWVTAVESQFPDIMMHPSGLNAVAAFAQMDPSPLSPDKLQKAFTRARKELGLGPKEENVEQKRQMLSGGRVNGGAKGGGGGGKGETYVNVPKGWKEIARRAGMSEADYLRSYAQGNPKDVSRE